MCTESCLSQRPPSPRFNVINENDFVILVKDDDIGSDEYIGKGTGTLAKVRMNLTDRQEVTMMAKKSGHQHGFVAVSLKFEPNTPRPPAGQVCCQVAFLSIYFLP